MIDFPLRRSRSFVFALFVAVLCACSIQPTQNDAQRVVTPAPRLILISIDGFRADYIERGLSPALSALASRGVHADAMRPAFPSLTFPNHYTLVTGLYPDHHGIVHNRMSNPRTGAHYVYNTPDTTADPRWWGGEPIWVRAERHGIRSATMYWPGSDVAIDGVRPTYWKPFDAQKSPMQRVDTLLGWLDLPADQRPRFMTLYFEQVDKAGHDFGPESAEVDAAIGKVDAAISHLVEGLTQRQLDNSTNIVVVSDHGSTPSGRDKLIFIDDLVDLRRAQAISLGIVAGFRPRIAQRAYVERSLLGEHAHMQCWHKEDIPERFHYGHNARVPPLVCLAAPGWMITTHEYANGPKATFSLGEHGYDNELPDMRALFVAAGPSLRQGLRVAEFNNVDVYTLLARLLGLSPANNDGDPRTTLPMLSTPE
ncbi:MAG: ectonucleotide pyrophosphatase/phosphodiesterase [Tahibacter sp.]